MLKPNKTFDHKSSATESSNRNHSPFYVLFSGLVGLAFLVSGCGIFGGDDDVDPLHGDLAFEIEGEPGTSAFIAISWSTGPMEFSGETLGSYTIPENGRLVEDLENGQYEAYQVSASVSHEAPLTLRLISDGDILDETSEIEEEGYYLVKYGEFPDFGDWQ